MKDIFFVVLVVVVMSVVAVVWDNWNRPQPLISTVSATPSFPLDSPIDGWRDKLKAIKAEASSAEPVCQLIVPYWDVWDLQQLYDGREFAAEDSLLKKDMDDVEEALAMRILDGRYERMERRAPLGCSPNDVEAIEQWKDIYTRHYRLIERRFDLEVVERALERAQKTNDRPVASR